MKQKILLLNAFNSLLNRGYSCSLSQTYSLDPNDPNVTYFTLSLFVHLYGSGEVELGSITSMCPDIKPTVIADEDMFVTTVLMSTTFKVCS